MFLSLVRAATLALLACALFSGCALSIVTSNPRPNVDLGQQKQSLAFKMEPGVLDAFQVPSKNGVAGADVTGWHLTLENAFKNGFAEAFAKGGADSDLTLVIVEAEPTFAPTAVTANGQVVSVSAQLRYKARLLDKAGQVVRRSTATVASKKSVTSRNEASDSVAGAVESMYERLAVDLFGPEGAQKP